MRVIYFVHGIVHIYFQTFKNKIQSRLEKISNHRNAIFSSRSSNFLIKNFLR